MQLRRALLFVVLAATSHPILAAVLPEDRADALYHAYDGGGVEVSGPSVLIRKQLGSAVSVSANYYADAISSASIDVVTTASPYTENRNEHNFSIEYLHDSTIFSLGYNNSEESDYSSSTTSFSISQEMFGAMTTVTLGYSRGNDEVRNNTDESFEDDVKRQSYRLGISQVLTSSMLLGLTWETISDEGHLNNPYRQVRYVDDTVEKGYSSQPETYPRTRTSNAFAIRGNYYLPYRASLSAEYRFFTDSWGIDANNAELAYVHPLGETNWTIDLKYRYYEQTAADFYSDLYPYESFQDHLARDKELSTFSSHTIGLGVSYDFLHQGWAFLDRGSLNFSYDHILFSYDDFRDISKVGYTVGQEPKYEFEADVIRAFISVWY